MSTATSASNNPRITSVEVTDDTITAHLVDGRTISVPLVWWNANFATHSPPLSTAYTDPLNHCLKCV